MVKKEEKDTIFEKTKEKAIEAKEKAEDLVKDNPLTSIVVAAAVGAVVALGIIALAAKKEKSFMDKLKDRF